MVSLTTAVDRTDGVTFVRVRVENTGRARRVRVDNRLDGPVWPPRQQGRPVAGWDDDGFEGEVGADETLALGYASPASPRDPPAELASVGPAESDDDDTGLVATETPAGVLRSLGDPVVARAAVPTDGECVDSERADSARAGRERAEYARSTDDERVDSEWADGDSASTGRDGVELAERLAAIERRLDSLEGR
jgi:hypothetical protein